MQFYEVVLRVVFHSLCFLLYLSLCFCPFLYFCLFLFLFLYLHLCNNISIIFIEIFILKIMTALLSRNISQKNTTPSLAPNLNYQHHLYQIFPSSHPYPHHPPFSSVLSLHTVSSTDESTDS